jgi:hypothetical protein
MIKLAALELIKLASASWGVAARDKEAWRELTILTDVKPILFLEQAHDTGCTELIDASTHRRITAR